MPDAAPRNNYNVDDLCLQDLFLEQVAKTPDAIAVVDGSVELTYRELDEVSSKLAIQLIEEYGVGPDQVVGILMPRSVQYVIAYCAVLKAGGAYMPLELVYPKPLLERAVAETNAKVTLTNAQYVDRVQEQPHLIMGDQAPFYDYKTTLTYPPPSYVHPNADHLAFCVMSSGTSGTPKGICQTHRAAVHSYMDRFTRFPYFCSGGQAGGQVVQDRVGAGVFFVWECFRPLCRGATCVIIPDHVLFDPHAVTQWVQDYAITRLLLTPSLLQLILDTLSAESLVERLQNLRYLWLCGEVVSRLLAVRFTTLLPDAELMNLYSISECHDVSIGDLKRELDPARKYATCGTEIPGVTFYIVDLESANTPKSMKLVPKGERGEVFVGGPVVGRGYWNLPETTAERFVANPFDDSTNYSKILYRTGDLGRILQTNGHLEILGRCDYMVKIRGYSVVLPSIEYALAKHPQLFSSVVIAVGQETSDKKLVAYVVPSDWQNPPSASSVRTFLKDHLPPYAIPSTFCVIEALPVAATAAGKLDRRKLPNPETAPRLPAFSPEEDQSSNNDKAPQNQTEQTILELWCDLLEVPGEELSVLDNFFDVGGHSLLASRLVSLVNKKLQRTTETGLSIVNIMQAPTIRDMAEKLLLGNGGGETNNKNSSSPVVDLQAEAEALDPSIQHPISTHEGSALLLPPRVIFLTGATGYLGVHILAELLFSSSSKVTVIALARAKTDELAKERILQNLQKHDLLQEEEENNKSILDSRLIAVAGDLELPFLGMNYAEFKSLALEIDSIIHCGAQVNLIKPYSSLKASNVLGTQEILRLATTHGFVKTKVKPVHYISTNGIFPVNVQAYPEKNGEIICVKEDFQLQDLAPHLHEGYAMSKWVAEQMCTIAESSRGVPVSILRPGNMAGSSITGVQNPDDFNYLLIQGILETKCAPLVGTNYAVDLTPVDFAARAVVHLAVHAAPATAIGKRFHLQSPQKPVPLSQVVDMLRQMGYTLESVSREEWMQRISDTNSKLAFGWLSFEKYFEASTWLQFGSDNLQQALPSDCNCPILDPALLEKWFPRTTKN